VEPDVAVDQVDVLKTHFQLLLRLRHLDRQAKVKEADPKKSALKYPINWRTTVDSDY
jgi:hypothetical protein